MIKFPSKHITKLDLSNLELTEFPKEILSLKNLKKLNLSNNKIKSIPKEIETSKRLESLDLSNNEITNFYSKICMLKKLKFLNLNNNKIKNIPIQINNLTGLEKLQIANNKLSKLPESFSEIKNLKELNLSRNYFEQFPLSIIQLKSLEKLWINHLPLKKFPKQKIISNLINLKCIYCFGNLSNTTVIDNTYLKLTKLKGNSIKELKESKVSTPTKKMKGNLEKTPNKILKNKIFISYSHKDNDWLELVQKNLKVLKTINYDFDLWDDTKIKSGDKWKDEIEKALANAGIAILIISTDFLASDFIINDELPTLLKNAEDNGTRILPLIIGTCLFSDHPSLSEFQSINPPNSPLNSLSKPEIEKFLVKLAKDVKEILKS